MAFVTDVLSTGIEVGVVTSTNRVFAEEDLRRLGFPIKRFLCIQGADDTEFHKPDPRVFDPTLTLLAQKDISKEAMVYIGDAVRDYEAAKAAGLDFIGLLGDLIPQMRSREQVPRGSQAHSVRLSRMCKEENKHA